MRKLSVAALAALGLTALALAGCGGGEKVTIEQFDVREDTAYVEIGSEYTIPTALAVDSGGKEYTASVRVLDEDGNELTVTDGKVTPGAVGNYTVEYTVTYNGSDTEKKSFTLNVYDLTGPVIDCTLGANNYAPAGGSFDLSTIAVSDNSGETISPEISVTLNGEALTTDGNTVNFSEQGTYVISVSASDSSENETKADYRVFTSMDAESGISVYNEFYDTSVSDKFAHSGKNAYKVGVFMNNINWFDDKAMLGDVKILSETDYPKLSFWILFDVGEEGYEDYKNEDWSVSVNSQYYDMKVYDAYGNEVAKNWQDKYEFFARTWYRWEIDATKGLKEGYGAITETLNDFAIYLGIWDCVVGSNQLTSGSYAYIDDLKLVGADYDFSGEYAEAPEQPEEPAYTQGEKLADATSFDKMLTGIFDSGFKWVPMTDGAAENPVTYGSYYLMHGSAENPVEYSKENSTWQSFGSLENVEDYDATHTYTNNWKFYYGYGDAFVYAFKADMTVYAGLVVPAELAGNIGGTLTVYIERADGTMETVKTISLTDASSLSGLENYLLESGETIYFEFMHEGPEGGGYEDMMKNIGFPPYFAVYEAIAPADAEISA